MNIHEGAFGLVRIYSLSLLVWWCHCFFVFLLFSVPAAVAIIEELDHPSDVEKRVTELDQYLYSQTKVIIIRARTLGYETRKWISFGNWLHRTAIISSINCLMTAKVWGTDHVFLLPWGVLSILTGSIYAISWQTDPCMEYQVEKNADKIRTILKTSRLKDFDDDDLESDDYENEDCCNSVVLIHTHTLAKRLVCNAMVLLAAWICGYRIYKWYLKWLLEYPLQSPTAITNLALKPWTIFLTILLLQFGYCYQSILKW